MKSQNIHSVEITKLFKRRIRSLITEYRMILLERVEELSSNAYIGKSLKGSYKGKRVTKIEGQLNLFIKLFIAFNLPILMVLIGILLK